MAEHMDIFKKPADEHDKYLNSYRESDKTPGSSRIK
jgi:hypothetical protein